MWVCVHVCVCVCKGAAKFRKYKKLEKYDGELDIRWEGEREKSKSDAKVASDDFLERAFGRFRHQIIIFTF